MERHIRRNLFNCHLCWKDHKLKKRECSKKKKCRYFQNLDNFVIFLCRTIQGGRQSFKWNSLGLLHANQF